MNETAPPATGHEGVSAKLKSWLDDSARVQFRVLDTFASGPIVINHRIDQFVTSRPLTWEGVGVFFVKDGKIKEWSDYTIRTQR
jgi:limonene-1,2-epoxide hydrolase